MAVKGKPKKKPLTYEDLDNLARYHAIQAKHLAIAWQAPLFSFLIFGGLGYIFGYIFGQHIDAEFLAICFGIAAALVARVEVRAKYVRFEGFIPGFLLGGATMVALDLALGQIPSWLWFAIGLAFGLALDFYYKGKMGAG